MLYCEVTETDAEDVSDPSLPMKVILYVLPLPFGTVHEALSTPPENVEGMVFPFTLTDALVTATSSVIVASIGTVDFV